VNVSKVAYTLHRYWHVPDVIVDFLCQDDLLRVSIQNIGDGPAHNVSVSFTPEVTGIHGTTRISDLPLFQRLAFLPPGKEIRTPVDPVKEYFDREAPTQLTTVIHFENDMGDALSRSIEHDLDIYDVTTQSYNH
jgi:hypothetical protein